MALLIDIDAACAEHLQHAAMAGADPLTDALYAQLEAPAAEGAMPALPYAASQPTNPEHWGWWALALTLLAALASGCFYPLGA